jgi:hypothetical protein
VARGSHANYPNSERRTPNWASCIKPAFIDRLTSMASFSAAALETLPGSPYSTTCGTPADPQSCDVSLDVVDDETAAPFLRDLARLGTGDFLGIAFHTTRVSEPGLARNLGPQSPLDKTRKLGSDPIAALFGEDKRWECKAGPDVCRRPG